MGTSTKTPNKIAEPTECWETFEDAEYWRKQDFLRFTTAPRLNWLCEMLELAYRSGAIKPYQPTAKLRDI